MNRRKTTAVPGIEGTHNVAHLPTSTLSQNDAIGSHSHCSAHKLRKTDFTSALSVGLTCLKVNDVRVRGVQFANFFDTDQAFIYRNTAQKRGEQRCFPTPRRPRNEDIATHFKHSTQNLLRGVINTRSLAHLFKSEAAPSRNAQRNDRSLTGKRRNHRMNSDPHGQDSVNYRHSIIEAFTADRRHCDGQGSHFFLTRKAIVDRLHTLPTIDPDPSGIDQNIGDSRKTKQGCKDFPESIEARVKLF